MTDGALLPALDSARGGLGPKTFLPNAIVTLGRYPHWVLWRYEGEEGKKPSKVLMSRAAISARMCRTGLPGALSTQQWSSSRGARTTGFDGLGFVFSDRIHLGYRPGSLSRLGPVFSRLKQSKSLGGWTPIRRSARAVPA